MRTKYPQVGEIYESLLYAGQQCRVLNVLNAEVTFEWLGRFAHVDRQSAPVNRFVRDFAPADELGAGVPPASVGG